ncbi:MAG TPA: hypothetical protein VEI97_03600 [bacterium]|nr:hypothetical protein [bacterium]
MRSLRRKLEDQLDTPWLLLSRRELIAEELFIHLDDHRACLEEDGLPKDAAASEAWAAFGDLKAIAGEFLAQHRLEAYAFYCTFIVLFAAVLWPLPSLINYWVTGDAARVGVAFEGKAFAHRLLVTWELFWLFVLVRTAHCSATNPTRRWMVIGLLFPGYLLLGLLTPFILTFLFHGSLTAPWLAWFKPEWMRGWMTALQTSAPVWLPSDGNWLGHYITVNIIGLYLVRAYTVEGCWQGRDWPRLLIMTLLLCVGLTMLIDKQEVTKLVMTASNMTIWGYEQPLVQLKSSAMLFFYQLLLVGYFIGGLRAFDALWGVVLRARGKAKAAKAAALAGL